MDMENSNISNKLDDIQKLLQQRSQEHKLKEPDVFDTLLNKIEDMKEQSRTDVPAWVQALIAIIILVLSLGGSWVSVKVQNATMQEEIKTIQNQQIQNEETYRESATWDWRIKRLEDDIKILEKKVHDKE